MRDPGHGTSGAVDGRRADAALDALAPSARRAPAAVRLGLTAAVLLFLAAVAVAAMLALGASGGGDQGVTPAEDGGSVVSDDDADAPPAEVADAPVLVHVAGAVAEPGLVELAEGARVVDAVAAAGGLAPTADAAAVNLARVVVDGEQLIVPAIGEAPAAGAPAGVAGGSTGSAAVAPDGKVRLNSAGVAELDTLPRIGPALAQRIIDFRETNGPFTSVEQLHDVAGIGDAVFAGLVDLVTL